MTRQAASVLATASDAPDSSRDAFKHGMRALPGGVTIIAARSPDGEPLAMTASSVTSLSVDPPSLLVCVGRTASIARALVRLRHFSVNVLAAGQVEVAQAFGGQLAAVGAARFEYGQWRGLEGRAVPVLDGDDEATLAARVLRQEHRIYPQAVRWFAEGRMRLVDDRVRLAGEEAGGGVLIAPEVG